MLPLKLNQSLLSLMILVYISYTCTIKNCIHTLYSFSVLYHHFENSLSLYNDYSFLCVTIQAGGFNHVKI